MGLKISKTTLYQILFGLCIAVPYLNIYELTFVVWIMAATVTISKTYSFTISKQIISFSLILGIAFFVMFFHEDYQAYFIIRDITYMFKPIAGLLIGYQLCKRTFGKAFETIVITGFFIAVIHLIIIVFAIVVMNAYTVNDIRFYGGYFSDFEVYALVILIFHKKFELNLSTKRIKLFTAVVGLSVFLYLARTNFIQLLILVLGMKGYFELNKRAITVIFSLILASAVMYSAILYINPKRNGQGVEAFLYKIKIAPTEPFKLKINRDDYKDFNDNYRSYENILTVRQVSREGFWVVLFGEGLGSKIDLKQKVYLGDMELRYISILHNGFMTVFLKSGLLGIFIYLYSIFILYKKVRSEIPIVNQINLLLLGTGIFLIFSNWVFLGLYNLLDNKSMLIGFLICYREMAIKNGRIQTNA